tara:strand:+ start:5089 stop:5355 length:267 start_codon:yes stop_codon:yes gene_type:complete
MKNWMNLHIDDLDGEVTLFKSTEEGTETIAVFDEEHRAVIREMVSDYNRLHKEYMELKEAALGHRALDFSNLTHEDVLEEVLGYNPFV